LLGALEVATVVIRPTPPRAFNFIKKIRGDIMKKIETLLAIIVGLVFIGLLIVYFGYCASFWFKPLLQTPFICVSR